jgi:hypothetical protein
MKTPEDEAFDELARRQGSWGGGYQAKRQMAADKFIAAEEHKVGKRYGYVPRLHPSEYMGEPAQEPVAHVYLFDHEGRPRIAWDNAKGVQIGDKLYTAPLKREWVGLTDEEIKKICDCTHGYDADERIARAVEQLLKDKNA